MMNCGFGLAPDKEIRFKYLNIEQIKQIVICFFFFFNIVNLKDWLFVSSYTLSSKLLTIREHNFV